MKTNIKMRVTPEQSKKVQEIVFANGVEWIDGSTEEEHFNNPFLYITYNSSLMYGDDLDSFNSDGLYEEVDADLFIRTNGTCEEEPHIEMKRKFESRKYICVNKNASDRWEIQNAFQCLLPDECGAKYLEYKLIHKRHKEVLEYWLNGGDIEVLREDELCLDNPYFWKKCTKNFIESYHERKIYRIKQDQPQTRVFSTKKELAEALMRGEKWKVDGYSYEAYYKEELDDHPFRCGYWHLCDGKTIWTRIEQ